MSSGFLETTTVNMRIAIVAGTVPTTTFIDALINAMADEGYEMVVIGKKTGNYKYRPSVKVIITPSNKIEKFSFVLKNVLKCKWATVQKIRSGSKSFNAFINDLIFYLPLLNSKPDKVHIQWATFLKGKELMFDLFPSKILLSLRGAHINYKPITHPEFKEVYLRLFPRIYKFHAVSDEIGAEAVLYNADSKKMQTIYSYVDDAILAREIQPKPKGTLKIISIGRFHWVKGYDYALDAMGVLKKKVSDFTYTIIAQGTVPDDVIFQIDQLGLKDNVIIINGMDHKSVIKKIEDSDIMLLSSVIEGIANVALEAMAVGTPVISTDCGGINEVIKNNVNGFIVTNRDPEATADAFAAFNDLSSNERYTLALNAQKRVREYHNKKMFVEGYKTFYAS